MRHVNIVERPGEPYSFAAVNRQTGDILLRLSDRDALLGLCRRLGWTVHDEKSERVTDSYAPDGQKLAATRRGHHQANRRLGGASKYTSAHRRRSFGNRSARAPGDSD